jgi:general secretion pathway protein K
MNVRDDRGAALLTVLLLVAVMSALIAVSFDRVSLAIHRERNRSSSDEVRLDLISAEAIAVSRISQLTASADQSGGWQGQPVSVPVPGGKVSAMLVDGGNCFNLNALVHPLADGAYEQQPVAIAQFSRLLELSGVRPTVAVSISQATADWIDSDTATLPAGAEDSAYSRLSSPYRTANTLMVDKSEWRAVAGVKADLYERLSPLLCALPDTALPAYNINTLYPSQSVLIAALWAGGVTPAQINAALRNRPADGFDSQAASIQIHTRTNWFRLELVGELAEFQLRETGLIDGRLRPARLVRRSFGEQ